MDEVTTRKKCLGHSLDSLAIEIDLNRRPFNIDRSVASSSFGDLDPIALNAIVQRLIQQQAGGGTV